MTGRPIPKCSMCNRNGGVVTLTQQPCGCTRVVCVACAREGAATIGGSLVTTTPIASPSPVSTHTACGFEAPTLKWRITRTYNT